ncbi:alpha/beta-hydrolase [Parathielavia appendiculata]|uniref:Alpha/beta-hydrolase n=1 Tax=Parathielavia appendiculata TaxID=2587402 RepID=A0AAN6TRQ5_9PEZI|nr:alpha/beta-hydrolase [Parathielavia appendiculata]
MGPPSSFRAVYKMIDDQEIDVDVYLPQPQAIATNGVINIHGGAFMLGSSDMVNKDQVQDCLDRGWIVLAPNHRLCPQVDLYDGPMRDCRDLLNWVYSGDLQDVVSSIPDGPYPLDLDHVFAFGTSSGGTLALSLGFGVPQPVAGIFDMYGPCNFSNAFWTTELPQVAAKLPPGLTEKFINQVYTEKPVPTRGGVSLEGQAPGAPNFSDPRQAFAFTQIARGTVLKAIYPKGDLDRIDPVRNISASFPPTLIVHGTEDDMVPISLSRDLYRELQKCGVKCGMEEVPEEGHTFAAKMKVGSRTWELQRRGFDFLEGLVRGK